MYPGAQQKLQWLDDVYEVPLQQQSASLWQAPAWAIPQHLSRREALQHAGSCCHHAKPGTTSIPTILKAGLPQPPERHPCASCISCIFECKHHRELSTAMTWQVASAVTATWKPLSACVKELRSETAPTACVVAIILPSAFSRGTGL